MRVSQDDAVRRLFLALNIEPENNAQSETGYGRECAPLALFSARVVMQAMRTVLELTEQVCAQVQAPREMLSARKYL